MDEPLNCRMKEGRTSTFVRCMQHDYYSVSRFSVAVFRQFFSGKAPPGTLHVRATRTSVNERPLAVQNPSAVSSRRAGVELN